MNRRQEIAAWIFGLVIALALVATDHGIIALTVLAGLTIVSLRDRQKKTLKNKSAADPAEPNAAISETDDGLNNLAGRKSVSGHDVIEYLREVGNAALWAFVIWLIVRMFRPEHANHAAKFAAVVFPVLVIFGAAEKFLNEKAAKGFFIGCLALGGILLFVVPGRAVENEWLQKTRVGNVVLIVFHAASIFVGFLLILSLYFRTTGGRKHWRWFVERFPFLSELTWGLAEGIVPLTALLMFAEIAWRLAT